MNAWHLGYNGVTASSEIENVLKEETPVWKENFEAENTNTLSTRQLSFSYNGKDIILKNIDLGQNTPFFITNDTFPED